MHYMKTHDVLERCPRFHYQGARLGAGKDRYRQPCQYNYFAGASTGESVATMYNNANAGLYSFINRTRYYSNFTGEPNVLVGYQGNVL